MRVFVTGASGGIGTAVVAELLAAGHGVVGLARSDSSAATISGLGAEPLRGDIADLNVLREAASNADGVVYLAFSHDFSNVGDAIGPKRVRSPRSAMRSSTPVSRWCSRPARR